jgi:hypothetical protein
MIETTFEMKYNVPFEVTKNQYTALMNNLAGIVVGRFDDLSGKYFIKVWHTKYNNLIVNILKQTI